MNSSLVKVIRPLWRSFRWALEKFDRAVFPLFALHPVLSSLYYCMFSRKFDREHQSVLHGRMAYRRSINSPKSSHAMLRRNIHRLEKGIIMRPRRAVFGEGYVGETVDYFARCCHAFGLVSGEMQWAKDVLDEYFSIVEATPVIRKAKEEYDAALKYCCENDSSRASIPYPHKALRRADISFTQFKDLCIQRRSVRWFENRRVPVDLLKRAVEVATLAPSACNRQPFEFHVFSDPNDAAIVGAIPMGTVGFSHNFQCVAVLVGDLSAYPHERDRHVIYIDASLAAMQFMLALETLGLSSCAINWPDVESLERRMIKVLGLKPSERPVMVFSIGYADPDGLIPFSQKKDESELLKERRL